MKKIFFLICLSGSLNAFSTGKGNKNYHPQPFTDTTVLVQILALPLNTYLGKTVDSLFLVLPTNYTHRRFMPTRGSTANGVYQSYGIAEDNSVVVQIFIDNFQHVIFPAGSKASSWDMNSAKLETIAFIRILKNNVCIYSCGHPFYHD